MPLTTPKTHVIDHAQLPGTTLVSILITLDSLNRTHHQIASSLHAIAQSLYAFQSDLAQYDAHVCSFLDKLQK